MPLGTSETLCLLSATMAWREHLKTQLQLVIEAYHLINYEQEDFQEMGNYSEIQLKLPTIIYTTHTHAQLSQVLSIFSSTSYSTSLEISILDDITKIKIHPIATNLDHPLPLHRAKQQPTTKNADMIFALYSVMLDSKQCNLLPIDWNDSVILFDQAHYLESLATDLNSIKFTDTDIEQVHCFSIFIRNQVQHFDQYLIENMEGDPIEFFTKEQVDPFILFLDHFKTRFESIPLMWQMSNVFDGEFLFHFFQNLGITTANADGYIKMMQYMISVLDPINQVNGTNQNNQVDGTNQVNQVDENNQNNQLDGANQNNQLDGANKVNQLNRTNKVNQLNRTNQSNQLDPSRANEGLINIIQCLDTLFRSGYNVMDFSQHYKVVIHQESPFPLSPFVRRTCSLYCMDMVLPIARLINKGIRNIIFTSFALTPMNFLNFELGQPMPILLENTHLISSSQIWVGVLTQAVDGICLNSANRARTKTYMRSLGYTLANIARIVPGGLVIFFPSYELMDDCIHLWQQPNDANGSNGWDQICQFKSPIQRTRDGLIKVPREGTRDVVLFAVCQGDESETIDFSDHNIRAIVITGLPYPSAANSSIKVKREHLDQVISNRLHTSSWKRNLSSAEWYHLSAWRMVNQCIGRVIRHERDYGAIILADERFATSNDYLTKWIKPHVQRFDHLGTAFMSMTKFFSKNLVNNSASNESNEKESKNASDEIQVNNESNSIQSSQLDPFPDRIRPEDAVKAKLLMKQVKEGLTRRQWCSFQMCLRKFRDKKMTPCELYAKLENLFQNNPTLMQCLRDYLSDHPFGINDNINGN